MTQVNNSVSETQIVSPERVIDTMRRLLHREIKVTRRFTVDQLAEESGVKARVIRCWMSEDEDANREPKLSAALSVAVVIGPKAVNAILAIIGYVGSPLEDAEATQPMQLVAEAMSDLSAIASAAADNRFDHTEMPAVEHSADHIIEILTPISSRRRAA